MAQWTDAVTVVSGVPRSGTSLVMQMLGAGGHALLVDDARPADIHNPRGYYEFAPVKRLRDDASWVAGAAGRAVKVVHTLVEFLPPGHEYRVILVRRDLREVVASQNAMLAGAGPAAPPPDRLAEIYAAQLAELERWLAERGNVRVLALEHRRLLREPLAVARELSRFLGGALDVPRMAAVVDAALHRRRGG